MIPLTRLNVFCFYGCAQGPQQGTSAAPLPATSMSNAIFGQMAMRATGLEESQQPKRHCSVRRNDLAWSCVVVTDETDIKQPRWQCLGCGEFKSGGASKITNHLLGLSQSKKCSRSKADATFNENFEAVKAESMRKSQQKQQKLNVALSNQAALAGASFALSSASRTGSRDVNQPTLNFNQAHSDHCDAAMAEMFYACNISAAVADHPRFKKFISVIRTAPPSWKMPNRQKMLQNLLDDTCDNVRARLAPLRQKVMQNCGTLLSDGWDTAEHDHLINFLFGNASCMFFEGTVELKSNDQETAEMVAELMRQQIERIGKFAFIQVCTDTCSTMQVRAIYHHTLDSRIPVLPLCTLP